MKMILMVLFPKLRSYRKDNFEGQNSTFANKTCATNGSCVVFESLNRSEETLRIVKKTTAAEEFWELAFDLVWFTCRK